MTKTLVELFTTQMESDFWLGEYVYRKMMATPNFNDHYDTYLAECIEGDENLYEFLVLDARREYGEGSPEEKDSLYNFVFQSINNSMRKYAKGIGNFSNSETFMMNIAFKHGYYPIRYDIDPFSILNNVLSGIIKKNRLIIPLSILIEDSAGDDILPYMEKNNDRILRMLMFRSGGMPVPYVGIDTIGELALFHIDRALKNLFSNGRLSYFLKFPISVHNSDKEFKYFKAFYRCADYFLQRIAHNHNEIKFENSVKSFIKDYKILFPHNYTKSSAIKRAAGLFLWDTYQKCGDKKATLRSFKDMIENLYYKSFKISAEYTLNTSRLSKRSGKDLNFWIRKTASCIECEAVLPFKKDK